MIWVILAIALLAIALVAVLSLQVFGAVKDLSREVGSAAERIAKAQEDLDAAQKSGPLAPPPVCTCGAAEAAVRRRSPLAPSVRTPDGTPVQVR